LGFAWIKLIYGWGKIVFHMGAESLQKRNKNHHCMIISLILKELIVGF